MTQDPSTYQGGRKKALFKVTVAPKAGGRPVYERIVPADSAKDAQNLERPAIERALIKRGLKSKDVTITTSKVTDLT